MKANLDEMTSALFRQAERAEDEGDEKLAIALFTRGARMGHAFMQNRLATLLCDRYRSKAPDAYRKAVYWYRLAVRNGDASAAWNLFCHYRILRNRRWRNYWLGRAAEMGHANANRALQKLAYRLGVA